MRGANPYFRVANTCLGKNGDHLPADPTLPLQPATKQYVDNLIAAIPTPAPTKVPLYPIVSQAC